MIKIGFIGAGKMAQALLSAVLRAKITSHENITCSDVMDSVLLGIKKQYGVGVTQDNREVFERAEVVFLAFKPQNFPQAIDGLGQMVGPDHLILSIMAGIRIAQIQTYLPGQIIRVMPNTACLVGQMAAGYALSENVEEKNLMIAQKILAAAGSAVRVSEDQLDAVTGLSGSGPAFVGYLIDGFIRAGIEAGLSADISRELTIETFAGTAKLLAEWKMMPAELISMVSSPNGTTVAGREILESSDVAEVIRRTVLRATERSKELGQSS